MAALLPVHCIHGICDSSSSSTSSCYLPLLDRTEEHKIARSYGVVIVSKVWHLSLFN